MLRGADADMVIICLTKRGATIAFLWVVFTRHCSQHGIVEREATPYTGDPEKGGPVHPGLCSNSDIGKHEPD
jgi:hypothetical protein